MAEGIMLPSGACKKSKKLPGCRSCFPVALLGWLKDLSGPGNMVGPTQPPSTEEPVEVAAERGSEGAGKGGPSPEISVLGFARGELWKTKEKNKEAMEVGWGWRDLCEAVRPPWVLGGSPVLSSKGVLGHLYY